MDHVALKPWQCDQNVTHFDKAPRPMYDPLAILLGPRISIIQCLQYEWAREFPDYKKCSANNLSIDFIKSNSHGPSMYTSCMVIAHHITSSIDRRAAAFLLPNVSIAKLKSLYSWTIDKLVNLDRSKIKKKWVRLFLDNIGGFMEYKRFLLVAT